jgi:hypothetical protein
MMFGQAVREGVWNTNNGGGQVKYENVANHISAVANYFALNGKSDPRRGGPNREGMMGAGGFARVLEVLKAEWKGQDPGVKNKRPIPPGVVTNMHAHKEEGPVEARLGDMGELGLTCLLRPQELSMTTDPNAPQFKQSKVIRMRSVRMYCTDKDQSLIFDGATIVKSLSEEECELMAKRLIEASHMEITFEQQKSLIKGQVVATRANMTYKGVGKDICGVKTMTRILTAILRQGGNQDTAINVVMVKGKRVMVTDHLLSDAIRKSAGEIGEEKLGFKISELMPHGLRAGGATLMMMLEETLTNIEVRGRWAPGSGALRTYLSAIMRTDKQSFTERLGEIGGAFKV